MQKVPLRKKTIRTNEQWRHKAVEIAKLISKHRDGYKCVTCGRSAEQGYQMHGSHIKPESKFKRLSVEPLNIMTQCFKCHSLWHEDPKGQDWFETKFPNRLKQIMDMESEFQKAIVKPDYKKIHDQLKGEYSAMI